MSSAPKYVIMLRQWTGASPATAATRAISYPSVLTASTAVWIVDIGVII